MKQSPTQLIAKIARRLKIPFDRLPADTLTQAIRKQLAENQVREAKVSEELKELAIQIKDTVESLEAAEELVQILEAELADAQDPIFRNSLLMKHAVATNRTIRNKKRLGDLTRRFVVLGLSLG